jgi:MFS family permease
MFGLLGAGGILTWILITDGGRDIAFNLSSELLPVYLSAVAGLTVSQVGIFRALRGGAMVLSTLGSGWLTDRLGESRTIIFGFFFQAAGLSLMTLSNGPIGLSVSALIFGAGIGMLFPAFDSLISKAVPEKMRGMAYGLFDSSRSILAMPGPLVGGILWERLSPRIPFLLTAIINLACAIPAVEKLRAQSPSPAPIKTLTESRSETSSD